MEAAKRQCDFFAKLEQRVQAKTERHLKDIEACTVACNALVAKIKLHEKHRQQCLLQQEIVEQLQQSPVFIPKTRYCTELADAEVDGALKSTNIKVELDFSFKFDPSKRTSLTYLRLCDDWQARLTQVMAANCPSDTVLICRNEDLEFQTHVDADCSTQDWQTMSHQYTFFLLQRT